MPEKFVYAMVNLKEKEALEFAKQLTESGEDPLAILAQCKEAMDIVGKRFEEGAYFLPELVMAGEMLRQISEIDKPKLTREVEMERLGKIMIGGGQIDEEIRKYTGADAYGLDAMAAV